MRMMPAIMKNPVSISGAKNLPVARPRMITMALNMVIAYQQIHRRNRRGL